MPYKIVDDLLYFDDDERELRLCVPSTMKVEVFKLAYDKIRHFGYARIHERLTEGLYIFNMSTKLYEFIRHYSHYQLNQTLRYKSYDFLQSILTSFRPFYTLTIDFILVLPRSFSLLDDCDYILLITNKFFKVVIFIVDKTT